MTKIYKPTMKMVKENSGIYRARIEYWERMTADCPETVFHSFDMFKESFRSKEYLQVLSLDNFNHQIALDTCSIGLINMCPTHPREVFEKAIIRHAVSIILVHNHPSGNCTPSDDDWGITRMIVAAGKIMRIPVVDHIIIGMGKFNSLSRLRPDVFQ